MKLVLTANKGGLYSKLLSRLEEAEKGNSKKDYIPFPVVFEKVCRGFSIKKNEAWECLFLLQELDFIEIIPYHGIKLKYKLVIK